MKKILLFTSIILLAFSIEVHAQHPTNLQANNITATSADLTWDATGCGTSVNLKFRISGSGSAGWVNLTGVPSPYLLNGLIPTTTYELYVKCAGTTGWSSPISFTTLIALPTIPTIDTAFISQPILCNGGYANDAMQITINQTSPATVYSCVVGQLFPNGYFLSYLSTNQTTTTSLNLQGFNPNVDYCIRIVDSAAYYSGNDIGNGGSASGTSTVGVYDEFCAINFAEPTQLVASTSVVDSNLCTGDCIAEQDLLISGGTKPYSFTINGGASQNLAVGDSTYSFVALCAGVYNIVVTDANGCSTSPLTTTFTIAPIAPIVPTGTVTVFNANGYHVSCNGADDGSITASATGGTGAFTYSIDGINFQSNTVFSGLSAGTETITYKDANGCIATEQLTLNEPPALSGTASITQVVDCFGASTGEITFAVDPTQLGVPTYQYSTDNGTTYQPSNIFTGLLGDSTYNVMIEDDNGCQYTSVIYLAEPTEIIYSITLSDYNGYEVSCNGSADGSIDFTSTIGGLAPYEYSTDGGGTFAQQTTYANLPSGTYNIEVKDASGCIKTSVIVLTDPGVFTIPDTISNPIDCPGDCNGAISINPVNGVGQILYSKNSQSQQTTPYFSGLCGATTFGTYTLDAIDDNGCTASEIISIAEPAAFVYTTSSNLEYCNQSNGQASISVTSGGTGGLSYIWNNDTLQNSSVANGLVAGIHTVVVKDGNDCQFSETVTVSEDLGFTLSFTTVSPCLGDSSGAATVTATGTPPYSYQWSDVNGIIAGETSATISGMPIGNYSVLVTDVTTCSIMSSVDIIAPIDPIVIDSIVVTNNSCFGINDAQIEIFASGGQPAYLYSDNNGLNQQSNPVFGMLMPGAYGIRAIDANGCFDDTSITITYPGLLQIDSTVFTHISCFGADDGVVQAIQFVGGTAPFEFSVDAGVLQSYMAFSGLDPGTHSVQVRDANNCESQDYIIINEPTLFEVSIVSSDWNNYQIRCNGDNSGYVDVNATGGTLPYYTIYNQFYFSPNFTVNGNTLDTAFFSLNPVYIYSWDSTANILDSTITNSLTILQFNDANNPTAVTDSFVAYASNLDVYTFDTLGNITDTTYFPADSTWLVSYYYLTGIDTAFGANSQMTGFPQGNHTFIVEDANGCNYTETILFNEPSPIEHNFITNHVTCVAWNNGSVTDSVYGGVGSSTTYSYLWDSGETTYSLDNLQADTSIITVTDENGCEDTESVIINANNAFNTDQGTINTVNCFDDCDGELSVLVSGGFPFTGLSPYTYLWNDYLGQNTETAVGLCVDSISLSTAYSCIVSDAVGCTDTVHFTLTQPAELQVDVSITSPISCNGENDGKLTASATLGTPIADTSLFGTYSINIDLVTDTVPVVILTPPTTINIDYLLVVTGEYMHDDSTLFTSDAAYNYSDTSAIMDWSLNGVSNIRPFPDVYSSTHTYNYHFLGDGDSLEFKFSDSLYSGALQFTLYEINYIYNYYWSTGGTDSIISGLSSGIYKVTIEDANTCRDTFEIYLAEPTLVEVSIQEFDIACFGDDKGSIEVLGIGGTSFELTYSYTLYLNGTPVADTVNYEAGSIDSIPYPFTNLSPGNYYVIAKDRNGCDVTSLSVEITEPFEPLTIMVDSVDETCQLNDGIIRIFPEGGGQSFNYYIIDINGDTTSSNTNTIGGNTAGWYDILVVDNRGCEIIDSVFIKDYQKVFMPDTLSSIDTTICLGQSITIDVDESPYLTYAWNDGVLSGDRIITPEVILAYGETATIVYTLTITDANNCEQYNNITVQFESIDPMPTSNPGVEYGSYPIVIAGDNIELFSENNNCVEYTWQWNTDAITNTNGSITIQEISETNWYYLSVKDADGCLGYDSIYVVVGVLPYEAITPNNDGFNDAWTPLDIKSYENALVQVFNRWGGLVFESNGGENYQAWDGTNNGKELAVGTYYYIIDLNTGDEPQTGPVTIIR